MDKNTIIGLVLMGIVLFGYTYWAQPSQEEIEAYQRQQDSIAQVESTHKAQAERKAQAEKAALTEQLSDTAQPFFSAMRGEEKAVTLSNDKLSLTLSSKGATVNKAVIKGFESLDGSPDVTLFDGKEQHLSFALAAKDYNFITDRLYFDPTDVTDSTVTFVADGGNGRRISLAYTLTDTYLLRMKFRAEGMEGLFKPGVGTMGVTWSEQCRQQEKGYTFENRYASVTYHETDGDTDHLKEVGDDKDKTLDEPIDWIAYKSQFFSAMIIAKDKFEKGASVSSIQRDKGCGYLKDYSAELTTQFDPTGAKATEMEFYFGPNDYRLLRKIEHQSAFDKDLELHSLVYLGWPIVRLINRWFTIYVFDFLMGLHINMGIVLILITILLKIITYPMVKRSYMSSAKMRVLKPKLEEATKQYNKPEDQMLKQQAMMAEYAKYGVSPLSGCLPMLIQMPIWIAMFNFVPNAIQLRGESFLWISDLSTYDPIIEWGKNIWLIGDHLSLTCILFCGSNLVYSFMTMRQQRDQMIGQQAEQMKMMQWMMYLMPLMFFFVFNDYSSGLNFYYFVSLVASATVMWALRHFTDDEKLLRKLEQHYQENKNNPTKASSLAARLEAMQQKQRELEAQREEIRRRRGLK